MEEMPYDICIVGSGPAGLTIASELSKTSLRICVLESGERHRTPAASALKETKSTGEISIRPSSRERVLGGTSTTWSGLSAPLDLIDLKKRDFLSHSSSWPIGREELDPYYERAASYGFAPLMTFDESEHMRLKNAGDSEIPSSLLVDKMFVASDPPWNFGKKLLHIFEQKNLTLILGATVIELISASEGDRAKVTAAKVRVNGKEELIRARIFVIAAGGLESARLLLLSKSTHSQGLGNNTDQVGRYVMNHPKGNFGIIRLHKPISSLPYRFGYLENGFAGYAGLRLSEREQIERRVLNSYVRFEPVFPWTDSRGVRALVRLAKASRSLLAWWKKRQKRLVELKDYNETGDDHVATARSFGPLGELFVILFDPFAVCAYLYHRLFPRARVRIRFIRLRNFLEMEPLASNRLTLGDKLDTHGRPLPEVHMSTSELDRRSLVELHGVLAEEVARSGFGILESDIGSASPWPVIMDASHHLGGTRMGADPRDSVVDPSLRVHETKNLYICSGSVFPTSGCANPTYTICALAIRLADELKRQLQAS